MNKIKFYEKLPINLLQITGNKKIIDKNIFEKKQDFFNVLSIEQNKQIELRDRLISKLHIRESEEDLLKYEFDLKVWNEDNIITQKVFDFWVVEKIDKFEELNFVTYYKIETLNEVIPHKIICVWSNKHFEDNIFSHIIWEYYKTDDWFKLITLEEDWNFKDWRFLKYNVFIEPSGSCTPYSSIKKPKQRTYKFFSRNVNPYLSWVQDFIIEWIEDWSFELPFMIEVDLT